MRSLTIRKEKRGNYAIVAPEGRKFSVCETRPGKWRASYGADGVRVRKHFDAQDKDTAADRAYHLLFGNWSHGEECVAHEIADLFLAWRKTLTCTEETIATDYWPRATQFVEWAEKRGLRLWRQLQLQHLQEYTRELIEKGLAKQTIALRTRVVRMAARWAARNWRKQYEDWTKGFRVPNMPRPLDYSERTSLTLAQVCEFLLWLRKQPHGWNILPGVALQGLCGLRVCEVLRMRWNSVDLGAGTVTVAGVVKNPHSVRRLPVPDLVTTILVEAPRVSENLLAYKRRGAYWRAFSRRWKRYGGPEIEPKGLRRTLPTEAITHGFAGYALERYLGHSPRTITDRHYVATDVQTLMRSQIVERVNEIVAPYFDLWSPQTGSKLAVVPLPCRNEQRGGES